jgi:DNA-binding response OmpR family regulator
MNGWRKEGVAMDKAHETATVMVVDDTPANLKLLQEMLQAKGYRVLAFPGGKMALSAAAKNPPDLILLDINMPEMNGFEVCERLKADEALKEIPVLFISALTETTDKVKAFSVGGVDYVTKPFQFEEVHARVQTHLELVRQKRELQDSYNKLHDLEALRDSLVHMIVHDMRQPLTVVLGNLELARTEPLLKDAIHHIGKASDSTRMLLETISSLLDVSKMEAGRMTLEFSAADMRVLVSETIRMVEPLKGQRTLTLVSPEEMESLACDAHLIQRVVQNLIGNALKFTDRKEGIITVSIEIWAPPA